MTTTRPGIERIFSWSALDEKSRVAILVTIFLVVSIAPAVGQSIETGWQVVDSGTDADLNAAVTHGESVWAFGDSGTVLFSEDGGVLWETQTSLGDSDLIAADSFEDSMAVLASDGLVYLMVGLNADWQTLDSSRTDMRSLAVTGSESLVLVGDSGVILEYSTGTWTERTSVFDKDLNDVSFRDDLNGFAVGDEGMILATTDGGLSWDYRETPSGAEGSALVSVEYFNPYRMFAVSDSGQILYSTSVGGYEWNLREIESEGYNTSLGVSLSSLNVVSSSKILFTGEDGFLGLSLDQGLNVEDNILPEGVSTSFNDHAMFDYLSESLLEMGV